jgi:general secretion pathway protein C
MSRLLHRCGCLVDIVALSLCGVLLAHAAALAFDPGEAAAAISAGRPRASPAPARSSGVAAIVERNLFCSSCRGASAAVPEPHQPERTALPLAVLAIMYAPPPRDPRGSLAVVRDTEQRSIHAVGIGDRLRGATVLDMGPTRLLLRDGDRDQYLDLLAPADAPRALAPVAASADPLAAELERGVRKLGEGSYEIERATLNAVLANTPALAQGARIQPELRDGKAIGFRLVTVRADGPFARIGLRGGDVISAINGLPLSAPESALDAFVKLRSASHLSLALEREGRRLTHEYRIR